MKYRYSAALSAISLQHNALRALVSAFSAFACALVSAQTVQLNSPPKPNVAPLSEQKINPGSLKQITLGDLVITKAEARIFPAALAGLPAPKQQLRVNYCVKNVGATAVNGPIRAKFYWASVGAFSAVPAIPGMSGNLFDVSGTLNPNAEHCGMISLNFDSAAVLNELGVLKQNPTVGAWAQGSNEGSNTANKVANNTKAVTLIGANPTP